MGIESALYASGAGLAAHGTALAAVSDNVANLNTPGFKRQRAEFEALMPAFQEDGGSIPVTGNGSAVPEVGLVFEQGAVEPTGRALDLAVTGRGFFVVGTAEDPFFTRDGSFRIGGDGTVQTRGGRQLLGTPVGAPAGTLAPFDASGLDVGGIETTVLAPTGNLSSVAEATQLPPAGLSLNQTAQLASFSFQSNVTDSLGGSRELQLNFFKTANNTWTGQAYVDGADVGQEAGSAVLVGQVDIAFDEQGAAIGTPTITATPQWVDGAAAGNFTIDLSGLSQFASVSRFLSTGNNGVSAGNIVDFSLNGDGFLTAVLDNGNTANLGTIVLGNFVNLDGLSRVGENLFRPGANAGALTLGTPGAGGSGDIVGGSIERSNVDVATEFVELVVLQRGYQANSSMFNASFEAIRDAIGLIR